MVHIYSGELTVKQSDWVYVVSLRNTNSVISETLADR